MHCTAPSFCLTSILYINSLSTGEENHRIIPKPIQSREFPIITLITARYRNRSLTAHWVSCLQDTCQAAYLSLAAEYPPRLLLVTHLSRDAQHDRWLVHFGSRDLLIAIFGGADSQRPRNKCSSCVQAPCSKQVCHQF